MIQTYFGLGKGKTTAAIGGTIRAIGCGKKALFIQFLKKDNTNECKTLKQLKVECLHPNCEYSIFEKLTEESIKKRTNKCAEFFENLKSIINNYDFIVLDEVLDLLEFGYLKEEQLLSVIDIANKETEIVLTGHNLSENIKNISDYISFIEEIKHPFNNGQKVREGIEY